MIPSLKCKAVKKIIQKSIGMDPELKKQLMIECILERLKSGTTLHSFLHGLDCRRAWALGSISSAHCDSIYTLFQKPNPFQDGTCRIRDMIINLRKGPDQKISHHQKYKLLDLLGPEAISLLFHHFFSR